MRNLLVLITLIVMSSNLKAAVICEKNGRYWYPVNETAKKIASSLGVKTCNGKRFKAVVAALNEQSNVVAAKKNMTVEETIKALK